VSEVILASASPRRRALLNLLGIPHRVVPSGVSEEDNGGESPRERAVRLAVAKARGATRSATSDPLVIGADTLVVRDGEAMGKPRDENEAAVILKKLSGRSHEVVTGLCLLSGERGPVTGVAVSRVVFHPMTEEEIGWYVATGEPMGKAGAYAVQGMGAVFIERIEGSFHNVVGFPVDLFYRLLPEAGFSLRQLRGE